MRRTQLLLLSLLALGIVAVIEIGRDSGRREAAASRPATRAQPDAPAASPILAAEAPKESPANLVEELVETFELDKGELLHFVVRQEGADLAVFLEDPEGHRRLEIDSPNGSLGLEWMDWIAEEKGRYRIVLNGHRPAIGGYSVLAAERRQPRPRDRQRAAATRATGEALAAWRARRPEAQTGFAAAARQWRQIPEARTELLTTLQRWSAAAKWNGDFGTALAALRTAEPVAVSMGATAIAADIANSRAELLVGQGRYREARAAASTALSRARDCNHQVAIAVALGALGAADQGLGEFASALHHYEAAEESLRRLNQTRSAAILRGNIGMLLNLTARWREAADAFREALGLLDPEKDQRTIAVAHSGLAISLYQLDDPGWRTELDAAVAIQRRIGDPKGLPRTLERIAALAVEEGDFTRAEAAYDELDRLYPGLDDPLGEAYSHANRAWMEVRRGRPQKAMAEVHRALPVLIRYDDRIGQAYALLARAEAERRSGRPTAARATAEAAIRLVENQREKIAKPTWRMEFLDPRLSFFDTYVELLMELHQREPEAGHDLEAFEATERGRARGLLDLLAARCGPLQGTRPYPPRRRADLIGLREPETLFLVYYLSRERAYLWSFGPAGHRSFDLGPARRIQDQVRATYRRLSQDAPLKTQLAEDLVELSHLLLPPKALQDAALRVVVVGDGPIRYVPFALLPDPVGGMALVRKFELASLPSLSVLAALRQMAPTPPASGHLLAVVADPRLTGRGTKGNGGAAGRAARSLGLEGLDRLPYSRIEAERLLAIVPPGERLAMLGDAARRDWVLEGFLRPYRFVHFATHGLVDPRDVQGSGLVLSQVDVAGAEMEAFLSFADIGTIRLEADLVVASACQTAMGRDLRGEGPVGVAQAFLAAGARRTIGSLWRVDDRTTAELMTELYRHLIAEKRPAAEALRRTQLSFLESGRSSPGKGWAAFVLLGEYR